MIRLGATDRLCETLVSWRLLVGGLSPWLGHRSYSTTSEEPPRSIFNSYGDIPNAEALVTIVAEELRTLIPNVKTNVGVGRGSERTDIDVVALAGSVLYMFECKHSITPTGAHEMRDLWRDIQKGVSQLELACAILSERAGDYLAGWFPGTDREIAMAVRPSPCVLCSHRVFSGLTIRDLPVRDYASLALTLGDGTVNMGMAGAGDDVSLVRYRLRSSERPTLADLDDYLDEGARFFGMFRPHMQPYSRLERLTESLVLTQETFVYNLELQAWQATLEELGAQRLPDAVVKVAPP